MGFALSSLARSLTTLITFTAEHNSPWRVALSLDLHFCRLFYPQSLLLRSSRQQGAPLLIYATDCSSSCGLSTGI
jgi:hypothetical protein